MGRENRLDALLALRLSRGSSGMVMHSGEADDVVAALEAADRLIALRSVEPEESFARTLESRLLARAEVLAMSTPATETTADQHDARGLGTVNYPAPRRRVVRRTRRLWPLVAAASLALVVGVGTLTVVAAEAGPGSLLYAVHRWEQGVRVGLAPTAADRAQLHLENAHAALDALNVAVAHREGDPAYSDALATLTAEDHAAVTTVAALSPGAELNSLTAQLNSLHREEIPDLFAALPLIGWQDQLATTQALGNLGAAIPRVNSVTLQQVGSDGSHGWKVTITGSGFEPGAELVGRGGAVVGQVIAGGSTQLIVNITDGERHLLAKDAGVRNPDSTAAALAPITEVSPREGSGAGAQGTPSAGSGGSHGGGHQPTPSPSVPEGK
jgi:hypothetical protein